MRRTPETDNIPELQIFHDSWDKKREYDFEVCYWRKCWNVRNDILWLIGGRFDEKFKFNLTTEDVNNIVKLLQSYNSENWEESGGSIWDWDDEEWPYSEYIQRNIKDLMYLRVLMDKYKLEVYFYDSY